MDVERRQDFRVAMELDGSARIGNTWHAIEVVNLSAGGVAFLASEPARVGRVIRLKFDLAPELAASVRLESFAIEAHIVDCDELFALTEHAPAVYRIHGTFASVASDDERAIARRVVAAAQRLVLSRQSDAH